MLFNSINNNVKEYNSLYEKYSNLGLSEQELKQFKFLKEAETLSTIFKSAFLFLRKNQIMKDDFKLVFSSLDKTPSTKAMIIELINLLSTSFTKQQTLHEPIYYELIFNTYPVLILLLTPKNLINFAYSCDKIKIKKSNPFRPKTSVALDIISFYYLQLSKTDHNNPQTIEFIQNEIKNLIPVMIKNFEYDYISQYQSQKKENNLYIPHINKKEPINSSHSIIQKITHSFYYKNYIKDSINFNNLISNSFNYIFRFNPFISIDNSFVIENIKNNLPFDFNHSEFINEQITLAFNKQYILNLNNIKTKFHKEDLRIIFEKTPKENEILFKIPFASIDNNQFTPAPALAKFIIDTIHRINIEKNEFGITNFTFDYEKLSTQFTSLETDEYYSFLGGKLFVEIDPKFHKIFEAAFTDFLSTAYNNNLNYLNSYGCLSSNENNLSLMDYFKQHLLLSKLDSNDSDNMKNSTLTKRKKI